MMNSAKEVRSGLLTGDGNVGPIDATAGVNILSEVAGVSRLKILSPC